MVRAMAPRLALGLLLAGADGFSPFAGVEELKPQRLADYCGEAVAEDGEEGQRGLRWCQHSIRKRLEDGGDVELSWRMRADPDSILSLDTEAEHGVRMLRCGPSELELAVPDSHLGHLQPGKLVVGSRFVHACEHMPDKHLYHRVVRVQASKPGPSGTQRVHLATEELPNFAHAVPSLSFSFSYMPVEAADVVSHPEMRTDYGLNREYLQGREVKVKERRLLNPFAFIKKLQKMKGVEETNGGFKAGGRSGGTISTQNGILNLMPKQVSNFGWNWNFFMNTTEEPNYNITIPGARGKVHVRKPYVKVHSGIFLNFTSAFGGLTAVPHVQWAFGMRGHGHVEGRVLAVLNTTSEAGVDPIKKFRLPLLEKLHKAQWFGKVDFATGHMPISFAPGFKFNAKMYHKGPFHGAVAFGGKTHGYLTPSLHFDSLKGFDVRWNGTLHDTEVIPPLWMIFTKRFEIGIMLKPMILMRGNFAGLEKATMAIEFRPYMNLTITRDGDNSTYQEEDSRMLTVYPCRVMGLTDVQFHRKYKVKIEMLGAAVETDPEMNWGQVSFHDHISKFSMGTTSQQSVIEQPITVTLYEVDDSTAVATERPLGTGEVRCTSLLDGVCHPSPPIARIMQGSIEVAAVELAVVWQDSPTAWFASKIRGVGVSVPQLALRQGSLKSVAGPTGRLTQGLTMHLVHDGLTYVVPVKGDPNTTAALYGGSVLEFGPGFLETWLPCSAAAGAKCESPRLELYYGVKQVAVANLPQIDWTSQTAMEGTRDSFASQSSSMSVPCSVVLYAPGSSTDSVAVVTMNAEIVNPASASFVWEPISASKVPLTAPLRVAWTISSVDKNKEYFFTMSPLRLVAVLPSQMQNYVSYRKVGNQVLEPVANRSVSFAAKCTSVAIGDMAAGEAPCSFVHSLPVSVGFTVGDQVVVRIKWTTDGKEHEMYSQAFVVAPKAPARRLLEPREPFQPIEPPKQLRRLLGHFKDKWNSRVGQHAASCSKKNLHFNVGAGMLFRGRVDNVGVPKGFPMLGGLDEAPQLTTGFKRIMGLKNKSGEDLQDLLPAELCKGGLCAGALPGCTDANIKKLFYPKLKFNISRPYHYDMRKKKGKFHGLFKKVIAYAFSTLPEVVDVITTQLNESHHTTAAPTAPPYVPPVATPQPLPARGPLDPQTPAPAPVPPSPAAGGQAAHNTGGAFDRWWSGAARRLSSAPSSVQQSREPPESEPLVSNQVEVTFPRGIGYKLDRPLVERMLQHGYFTDIEDEASEELGPLRITSLYRIDAGGEEEGEEADRGERAEEAESAERLLQPRRVLPLLLVAASVVLAVAALAVKRASLPRVGRGTLAASAIYAEEPQALE